ncbi:DUF4833 domain-containing protein [Sphingobacterium sp. DK4209]|uniref:DUF4833 domain-containing protein n=1 Tax=Sphingobacterium zhuxiongii TaxID=2662364 RepID=A0A5Q0QIY8_9SPHI|nr:MULTISPECIES: DUF4833 domain-containing protein [unclassified Sphingobacterium]MVZ67275.1 DUF4833 domain-containing protein [Sphingobacterium sp. DK4209]QGA27620.1 DUF4833 domain-containing protein [Sphingobacterium sp. dk4302]
MKQTWLLLCFISFIFPVSAQQGYPTPTNMQNVLFYIQHNRGHNTYIYSINKSDNGTLDSNSPINVYRQLFDDGGKIKPLTAIQRKFAYGISTESIDSDSYEASIVSLPTQKFILHVKPKNGSYVETTVNQVKMHVQRIFIQQKEGTSGLTTKVDYILFYGKVGQKAVVERLEITD